VSQEATVRGARSAAATRPLIATTSERQARTDGEETETTIGTRAEE
jgi:hypothetical protein